MTVLRVVSFGLGPIGLAAARLALQKKTIQLVGAIDTDNKKVGKDLGDLCELGNKNGVIVESDARAVFKRLRPHVILHCTSSFLPSVKDQLLLAAECGVNVVSSTEELLVPDLQHPELAKELQTAAVQGGITILGTGINPGFAMDYLAAIASAVTLDVNGVQCTRVVDAGTRRLPLQKKVGAGLSKAEFDKQLATGKFGHIGLRESVALIGRTLGLEIDKIEQTVEPVIATEDHATQFLTVKKGQVAGLRNHGYGRRGSKTIVHLDLSMFVGAPDPRDEVVLDSTPPIHLKFAGGIPGDQATAAILVNTLHQVYAATPGLKTIMDIAAPRLCR